MNFQGAFIKKMLQKLKEKNNESKTLSNLPRKAVRRLGMEKEKLKIQKQ